MFGTVCEQLLNEEVVDRSDTGLGLHQLVLIHGRERAREMVPERQRPLVDIAAEVMADESQRIGISYTGFCLTSLPHKRLPDEQTWEKKGHRVTLWVEPGRMKARGKVVTYGVPYGARARMILLYLQTQAVRTGSREVELGRSMRDWMERMGLVGRRRDGPQPARTGRPDFRLLAEILLGGRRQERAGQRGAIVNSGLRFHVPGSAQGSLWEERVVLDEMFWNALRDHPVPLQEAAIRELRDRSMSLDIYVWLAWRLHTLAKATPVSWPAIHAQFGTGFRELRHFRPRFIEALGAAVAAYPEARVDVGDAGITLHSSRPPVARISSPRLTRA